MDTIFEITLEVREGERFHFDVTTVIAPDLDTANEWSKKLLSSYFMKGTQGDVDVESWVFDATGEACARVYDVSQVGPFQSFRNLSGGFTKVYYTIGTKPLLTEKDLDHRLLKAQYRQLAGMLHGSLELTEAQQEAIEGILEMVDTIAIRHNKES